MAQHGFGLGRRLAGQDGPNHASEAQGALVRIATNADTLLYCARQLREPQATPDGTAEELRAAAVTARAMVVQATIALSDVSMAVGALETLAEQRTE